METLGRVRASSAVLLLGLCVSVVAAAQLPVAWGWENGHLENMQAAILWVGAAAAVAAAWQQRALPGASIWRVAAVLWLVMLGRELAWGAVFFPPLAFDALHGPQYSSSVLAWKPAVKWLGMALLACCLLWVLRDRLVSRVGVRWWRERAIPWGALAVFVLAMLLSAQAEGHGAAMLGSWSAESLLVMEEMAECWAYVALWWGQWALQQHMHDWRQSSCGHAQYVADAEPWEGRSIG